MIRANNRKTVSALLGMGIAALLLWVWKPRQDMTYHHNEGYIFGTMYNIRYEASEDLEKEIQAALKAFDNSLSMFNTHSTLSAINANRDTITDSDFETMFREAERIYALSNGAFDITVAPLVNYWGFGRTQNTDRCADRAQTDIDSLRAFVGFEKVRMEDHTIVKTDPRVQLDGGAVAKGQACDKIATVLRDHGCTNYLVEIGGEIVAHGVNAQGDAWRVGLAKPNLNNEGAADTMQEILQLHDICMATSGNYRNFYYDGDIRRSHTIDPRSGYPVQHSLLSATVVSTTCMRADALATACMVLGTDEALDMIERAEDAACYLIVAQNDSLTVVTSPNWADFIKK